MRVRAVIDVVNRDLPCGTLKKPGLPSKSSLAIGRKPLVEGGSEIFMMLYTAQNMSGVKYSIKENIKTVFTKFIKEGKATVRLHKPPIDLLISKADLIELKSFLIALKKVLDGKDLEGLTLSALQPASAKQVAGPKTRLTVTQKKDYPCVAGFDIALTTLRVNSCRLTRLDSRMLRLRNLTDLDLSGNDIVKLPPDMDTLTNLTQINLSNNQIEILPRGFCCGALSKSLRLLNISHNKISLLPSYFCRLRQLVTLNLDNNQLSHLPPAIGKLSNLKFLTLGDNNIKILPGTVVRLHLDNIKLSGNPLLTSAPPGSAENNSPSTPGPPSMLELVARYVIQHRTPYSEEDIPGRLMEYLESYTQCLCGRPVWNSGKVLAMAIELRRIASSVVADGRDALVLINATMCSQPCQDRYKNNPFAL